MPEALYVIVPAPLIGTSTARQEVGGVILT